MYMIIDDCGRDCGRYASRQRAERMARALTAARHATHLVLWAGVYLTGFYWDDDLVVEQ